MIWRLTTRGKRADRRPRLGERRNCLGSQRSSDLEPISKPSCVSPPGESGDKRPNARSQWLMWCALAELPRSRPHCRPKSLSFVSTHLSLTKNAPIPREAKRVGYVLAQPI